MSDRSSAAPPPLLELADLSVHAGGGTLVSGVDLQLSPGERVGLIGESGSGKSITCLSIMGLLPDGLRASGSLYLDGVAPNLIGAGERVLAPLRGRRMSMIFQEPMTALNPVMKVGRQIAEIMLLHGESVRTRAEARAVELLDRVGIADPRVAMQAYPHQLSGGQRQRVMLATAMANSPDLLLADEPTTALDVTVQSQVLDLMRQQVTDTGSALLFITHDLAVVSGLCDRVLIMRDGAVVETGPIDRVFTAPQHPYTRALLAASALATDPRTGRLITVPRDELPAPDQPVDDLETPPPSTPEPLPPTPEPVEGPPPSAPEPVEGRPRDVRPSTSSGAGGRGSGNDRTGRHDVLPDDPARQLTFNPAPAEVPPIIRVRELSRTYYRGRTSLFGPRRAISGLHPVSFDITAGERFGIVGESGSGKSTLLRLLCGLDHPTGGAAEVAGVDLGTRSVRALRPLRDRVQIVFQDPHSSLDPRMRVREVIAEPLRGVSAASRTARVAELLDSVGLPAAAANRYPHQFSGGQRQRIAIARALAIQPAVLLADEAVSALDVSVRAQVLNLLTDLVDAYHLTLVFVSHDLNVIRHTCDKVAVMQAGRIVECGPAADVYQNPQHPYTRELIGALPTLEYEVAR